MTLVACAEQVERGDPDRFLSAMAAPAPARAVLFPIYAFNLEVARAPWVTAEPMIAEMRLQWWRDALEEIQNGGPVRKHEVTTPLTEVLDAQGAALLDALIEARRWDCYRDPFEDSAHFDRYIDATSGNLLWAAARALGAPSGEAAIRDMAYGAGVANWLTAIPALEAANRIPLVDGRPDAVAALAKTALARLTRARKTRGLVPSQAQGALLSCWQAQGILTRAARDPQAVVEGRLAGSEFARRGGLLWAAFSGRW